MAFFFFNVCVPRKAVKLHEIVDLLLWLGEQVCFWVRHSVLRRQPRVAVNIDRLRRARAQMTVQDLDGLVVSGVLARQPAVRLARAPKGDVLSTELFFKKVL